MNVGFDGRLKEKLGQRRPLLGLFISIPAAAISELAGLAGFDFLILDNEHGPAGLETTEHLIRAATCAGVPPVVRVSGADPREILRTLDIGAAGVQVPQVNSRQQAELVVQAAKYPPAGIRGVAFSTRAASYGFATATDHVRNSNDQTVVVVHMETVEALQNLPEIATVPGIDAIFIGPTDLSTSMGHAGNPDHPEVQAAIEGAVGVIRAAGKAPGILISGPDAFRRWAAAGVVYMPANVVNVMGQAFRTLTKVRHEI